MLAKSPQPRVLKVSRCAEPRDQSRESTFFPSLCRGYHRLVSRKEQATKVDSDEEPHHATPPPRLALEELGVGELCLLTGDIDLLTDLSALKKLDINTMHGRYPDASISDPITQLVNRVPNPLSLSQSAVSRWSQPSILHAICRP